MTDKAPKKIRERSISYPSLTVSEAIERADKLQKSYGGGSYSREDAAKGMGYGSLSGSSARAVAALVHYGLLERAGNVYVLSKLAQEILLPTSEAEKARAIRRAAIRPQLFEGLTIEYNDQALPNMLENIIFRKGVTREASKEAASTFKETLVFAGILKNGVISLSNEEDDTAEIDGGLNTSVISTNLSIAPRKDNGTSNDLKNAEHEYGISEAGNGWKISILSNTPLTSPIRTFLVDLIDLLEANSNQKEDGS